MLSYEIHNLGIVQLKSETRYHIQEGRTLVETPDLLWRLSDIKRPLALLIRLQTLNWADCRESSAF